MDGVRPLDHNIDRFTGWYETCSRVCLMGINYDVFLMLQPFRERVATFSILLTPLHRLGRSHLDGVDGYYDSRRDIALIALRFRSSYVTSAGFEAINQMVENPGLPIIIPTKLDHAERIEFCREILPRHDTYVQRYPHDGEEITMIDAVMQSLAVQWQSVRVVDEVIDEQSDRLASIIAQSDDARHRALTIPAAHALERALSPAVEQVHARALSPAIGMHPRALSPGFLR